MTSQAAIETVLWATVALTVLKATLVANAVWGVASSVEEIAKKRISTRVLLPARRRSNLAKPELSAASKADAEQSRTRTIVAHSHLWPQRQAGYGDGVQAPPKFRYNI